MEKAWLQREILIEKALCKVVSLLKRLFANRFIYRQMLFLNVVPLGTGSFQTGFLTDKAFLQRESLWNRPLSKGFRSGKGSF